MVVAAPVTAPAPLVDVLDRDMLDQLIGACVEASGLQTVVADVDGQVVVGPWNACPVCDQTLETWSRTAPHVSGSNLPSALRCRCGVMVVGAPIIGPSDSRLGRLFVGPYLASDSDAAVIADWQERTGFHGASYETLRRLPCVSHERAIAIARFLALTLKILVGEDLLANENAELLHELRAACADLAIRHAVAAALSAESDRDALLERLVQVLGSKLPHDAVSAWLVEGDSVVLRASRGMLIGDSRRARLKVGLGLAGHVAATATPLACRDIQVDPRLHMRANVSREGIHGQAGVPVLLENAVAGVLCLHQRTPYDFSQGELELLAQVAELLSPALSRAQTYEVVHQTFRVMQRQTEELESNAQLASRAQRFQAALIECLVAGGDVSAAAVLLGTELCADVLVSDARLRLLGSSTAGEWQLSIADAFRQPEPRLALDHATRERRALAIPPGVDPRGWAVAPVHAGARVHGYVIVERLTPLDDSELRLLEASAGLIAVAVASEKRVLDVQYRWNGSLLDDLISGDPDDLQSGRRRALHVGLDSDAPYVLLVGDSTPALDASIRDCDVPNLLVTRRGERLVVAVPMGPEGDDRLSVAATIQRGAEQALGRRVRFGLSRVCHRIEEFAEAFTETERLLDLADQLGLQATLITGEVVQLDRVLLGLAQPREALAFAEATLAPLERLDGSQNAQLVRTLEAYLRYGGVAQRVAQELDVHVNTVGYRLQRIRGLSGMDLDSPDVRLGLQIAFRIRRSSASIGGPP